MMAGPAPSARDPRVDLLRGLALLSIFVDHVPGNVLADFTLRNLGFSDAAEIFVLLAGFSATHAYGGVFDRQGTRAGLVRVLARCLRIYGTHVALLFATLILVSLWERRYGTHSTIVGPMLRDGWSGAMRGLSLRALPAYLDILPLYILLLAAFPLIRFGLARSTTATLGASALLYGAANAMHWNLRNVVDPTDKAHWYFDPYTWQLVFVLGCGLAIAVRRHSPLMVSPPRPLVALCLAYALGAFLVLDAWKLWPQPLPGEFYGTSPLLGIFGNEPKTFVSPWRLLNVLAIVYPVLTSARMTRVARLAALRPVVVCGRHSLPVFALGCVLALLGRLIFLTAGVTVWAQLVVNGVGLGAMVALGLLLEGRRARRADRERLELVRDAPHALAEGSFPSDGPAPA